MMALVAAAGFPEGLLFWPLAIAAVLSASGVLLARNPMYAAMGLVLSFFAVAGIYVLLAAQMLAALQVIVYAGAIMVLFLFVIMLLNLGEGELGRESTITRMVIGGGITVLFTGLSLVVFARLPQVLPAPLSTTFGTVEQIGLTLFGPFIIPFEAVSILLLVAIVGAVVVAKAKI